MSDDWSHGHWEGGKWVNTPPHARGINFTSFLGTVMWIVVCFTLVAIRIAVMVYSNDVCDYVKTAKDKANGALKDEVEPCTSKRGFLDFLMNMSVMVAGMCAFMLMFVLQHNYFSA
jgi:hypothetical protein